VTGTPPIDRRDVRWWIVVALVLAAGATADARADFSVPLTVEGDPVVFADGMVAVRFVPPFARADRRRVTFTPVHGRTRALRQFDGLLARAARLSEGEGFDDRADVVAAASPSWIAVTATRRRTSYDGGAEWSTVLSSETQVARRSGSARTIARCGHRSLEPVVEGTLIAYVNCDRTAIVIRDLTRPAGPPQQLAIPTGMQAGVPSLAGPYVSTILSPRQPETLEPQPPEHSLEETLVVFERSSGAQITRAAGLQIDSAALRADGTVAMSAAALGALRPAAACGYEGLSLFVVAPGGQPRALSHAACANPVTIDGDQIMFSHRTPAHDVGWAVTDVRGAAPRELADDRYYATFAGVDGLVRLESPACHDRSIGLVATAPLLLDGPDPVRPCTLHYPTRTVRIAPRGVLSIAYRCPAGCTGTMRLYLHGTHRLVQRRGSRLNLDAAPGQRASVRARLDPALRALQRRRGHLAIDALAIVRQIERANDSHVGTLRFQAKITLRR
jgi:hypothetical protein